MKTAPASKRLDSQARPDRAGTGAGDRWLRLGAAAALLAILVFGAVVRVVPADRAVFPIGGQVRLLGADAYYHLRHTHFAAVHFPHVQRYDIGTAYPKGERSEFAGLYDLGMAAVALLLGGGHPSSELVDLVVAWTPAALGLVALLLVFVLLRRVAGTAAALLGCAWLTLFPGAFLDRSMLGFSDHHAAEVVLVLASTWGAVACFFGQRQGWRAWLWALMQAAPMAALVFTWAGGPIQLVVMGLALAVMLLVAIARDRADGALGVRAARYGLALMLLVGVPSWALPELPLLPHTVAVVLGAIGALALGPALLLALSRWLIRRGLKPGWTALGMLLALAGAVTVVVVVLLPTHHWMHLLVERKSPLVQEHVVVTPMVALRTAGIPGVLALAAPLLCAWLTGRSRDGGRGGAGAGTGADAATGVGGGEPPGRAACFVSLVGASWLALWWLTYDYNYEVPVWSAALAALALWAVSAGVPRLARRRVPLYAGALLVSAVPVAAGFNEAPVVSQEALSALNQFNDAWDQALHWLDTVTPAPTLPIDARVPPWQGGDFAYPAGTYGVAVNWSWGDFVAARGHRVPVASEMVSEIMAQWLLLDDEDASLAFWDRRCGPHEQVRYFIIDAKTMGDHFAATAVAAGRNAASYLEVGSDHLPRYGRRYLQTMAGRLFFGLTNEMSHYRMVYETPHRTHLYYRAESLPGRNGRPGSAAVRLHSDPVDSPDEQARYQRFAQGGVVHEGDKTFYGATLVPSVRIFERVHGARVTGRAPPGSRVQAELALRSLSDGEQITYRHSVDVGDDGRFDLILPYSTDGRAPSSVTAMGRYQIAVLRGGRSVPVRQLDISEQRVQVGGILDIGELAPP